MADEIDTLTDQERKDLESRECKNLIDIKAEAKALRIIDAQTKRIAELEAKRPISGPLSASLVVALEGLDQTMVALTSAMKGPELAMLYVLLESIQERLETLALEASAEHERRR